MNLGIFTTTIPKPKLYNMEKKSDATSNDFKSASKTEKGLKKLWYNRSKNVADSRAWPQAQKLGNDLQPIKLKLHHTVLENAFALSFWQIPAEIRRSLWRHSQPPSSTTRDCLRPSFPWAIGHVRKIVKLHRCGKYIYIKPVKLHQLVFWYIRRCHVVLGWKDKEKGSCLLT